MAKKPHRKETTPAASTHAPAALAPPALRWRAETSTLGFDNTRDVEPVKGIIGQDTALEALRFGLECRAAGQNIFVRGLHGTGRMTMLHRLLTDLTPACPGGRDRCYVHNFEQPDRPKLISLPRGQGRLFRRLFDNLANFIRDDLRRALDAGSIAARRNALEQRAEQELRAITEPFEAALKRAGLVLVTQQMGPMVQSVLSPLVEGKPVTPEEFDQLHNAGHVSDEDHKRYQENRERFEQQFRDQLKAQLVELRQKHVNELKNLIMNEARALLFDYAHHIQQSLPDAQVNEFLKSVIENVVERRLHEEPNGDFTRAYRVNVVADRAAHAPCEVVVENTPTLANLLGGVDREWSPAGGVHSDHLMIRAGALLRADGGFLVLDARDVLSEPGSWKSLVRTLRSGRLEIVPPELSGPWFGPSLKPEAIDVDVKVILLGDSEIFYMLDQLDPDFPHLFKVLADFDSTIGRNAGSQRHYAAVLARLVHDEKLLHFDRAAVGALIEEGARIASRNGKLTARFGRLADVAREASFIAVQAQRQDVQAADVHEAITRTKRRADLPSRHFRELLADGTICVHTTGRVVGQINGLAVLSAGPLTSGFPARITATIGAGTAGVINIEREAALSGAIHTKGFYILGGLLRYLLQTDHPLAFDASVAFEQSYGGIDGDSASGAEICCLLSALTDVPLRQDIAMTGAIDQLGHILAIGAVNEKIEGFFDTCRDLGLTGTQGVIIPQANAGDLMLRPDVVEAAAGGKFSVWAVGTVHQALELLTGVAAGTRDAHGDYPADTLLGIAVQRARQYWEKATPASVEIGERNGAGAGDAAPKRLPSRSVNRSSRARARRARPGRR